MLFGCFCNLLLLLFNVVLLKELLGCCFKLFNVVLLKELLGWCFKLFNVVLLKELLGWWFKLLVVGVVGCVGDGVGCVIDVGLVVGVCVVVVMLLGWVFGFDGFFMGGVLNVFGICCCCCCGGCGRLGV